jgi:hypothetical protein
MRGAVYGPAILAGTLLVSMVSGRVWPTASAEETATRIEDAPCNWFTRLYPGAWGTDRKIAVAGNLVIEKTSFSRGTFQLDDGSDAYDYLEKRCGEK